MSIYDDTRCDDCKRETNHQLTDNAEYYMIHNELWHCAIQNKPANFLCVGCLEKRLKRKLVPEDFTDCPLNWMDGYHRSIRLRRRMGDPNQRLVRYEAELRAEELEEVNGRT